MKIEKIKKGLVYCCKHGPVKTVHHALELRDIARLRQSRTACAPAAEPDSLSRYEYKTWRYLRKREKQFRLDLNRLHLPYVKGTVSVILPCSGERAQLEATVQSVLAQTYAQLELILVPASGQADEAKSAASLAAPDSRIRLALPGGDTLAAALNAGVDAANGEYITWLTAGCRMRPDFLQKLVGHLQRHPGHALCFADCRDDAAGDVHLSHDVLRLNTYDENIIGPAFLYRHAVHALVGGYDPGLESGADYDFFMRIADALELAHADFDDIVLDVPSVPAERHDRLMFTEDFRRDWMIRPLCWVFSGSGDSSVWQQLARQAGHIALTPEQARALCWPELGSNIVQITLAEDDRPVSAPPRITADALRVLVRRGSMPQGDPHAFDLCVRIQPESLSDSVSVCRSFIRADDEKAAFDAVQVHAKMRGFSRLLLKNREQEVRTACRATIVLCTYKRVDAAQNALRAMLAQTLDPAAYEILVVNNNPSSDDMKQAVQRLCTGEDAGRIRYLDCPYPGLSAARNFSLYAAKGDILLYIDDDGLMYPDCLEKLLAAFDAHPEAGVIGGQILLREPERFADVLLPGFESLWSERRYDHPGFSFVQEDCDFPYGCNFAVRRRVARDLGGFRVSYGRTGKDYAGGEEMVLAHLAQNAGLQIGAESSAIVIHDVAPDRYTLEHVRQTMRNSRHTNRLMKMDLYTYYDGSMVEERYLLKHAKERLAQLRRTGVPEEDLRCRYAQFDIAATEEAIRAGEEDLRIMRQAKQGADQPPQPPAGPSSSLPTRAVRAGLRGIARLLGQRQTAQKLRGIEQEMAEYGPSYAYRQHKRAIKKRLRPSAVNLEELEALRRDIDAMELRQRREQINLLRQQKKILLIGTAEHSNIGDLAISKAAQELLLDQFPEYTQVEFSTFELDAQYDFLQAIVHRDDLFFFNGGGNLGNRYMEEEMLRRRVLSDYPNHKAVIMPQTISFTDDEEGRRQAALSADVYTRHSDLTLFVRGKASLQFAQAHFPGVRCALMPDTVFSMRTGYHLARRGILLCIRDDAESRLSPEERDRIAAAAQAYTEELSRTTNMAEREIGREARAARVNEELKRFAGHRVVITDRLHGMIFAAVTGTPVVVLRSADRKIEEYYEAFLAGSNAVFYVGTDLDRLNDALAQALRVEDPQYPTLCANPLDHLREYLGL